MVQVQWRVVVVVTVVLVGWLSAAESNRRKVIIHIPHLHHGHKQSVRHIQKGHSHSKGAGKGNGHVHKHHHHYYEDDHGGHGESSHSHVYDDPGHHHHHHPPPPPPPPQHHHHSHPSHVHHSSHHSHPVHHHHSDHHGHGSRHVDHHRHPDHLDDLDHHHHHLRSEESMYSYDHHHPEHSHQHHRVHHYTDHYHPSTTRSYDCMEICEKCKMKAHRHRYTVSRGHDVGLSGSGNPLGSQVVTSGNAPPPPPPPSSPVKTRPHQGYLVTESQEFKPMLAPGELRDESDSYAAGYVFPKPLEVMTTPGKSKNSGRKPFQQYQDQVPDFDGSYADFPEFGPDTQGWYNETFFFGKHHEDPGVNVVGYHRQRGQQMQQHSSLRYPDEGVHGSDEGKRKERGRDLRFLNRHRYETTNR